MSDLVWTFFLSILLWEIFKHAIAWFLNEMHEREVEEQHLEACDASTVITQLHRENYYSRQKGDRS